jgi:2-polyprenyl-6-methoxyphenol hydroxylase-like FAD-dependent oxidoreductase
MTTALVIGAGIAGPVAAMALQKAGIHAEMFEGHPTGADEIGSWLTLQANGIDALAAVDAHHVVTGIGFPQPSMRFLSGSGKVLGRMSNGAPLADGTPTQMMARADLYAALRDEAVERGASIVYGRRLVDATSEGGRVVATFTDGSTAEGDLLIGCDGIRSRVRQVIDPAAPPARYVPVLNIGGVVPDMTVDAPVGEFQMVFGKRCFWAYVATPDGRVGWFANPPRADEPRPGELAAMTDADWRTWLLDLTADDRGPFADIIRAATGPLVGWATYDMPTVPTWHRDNMIVIGDAAHATSPAAGQGAAMALEDAVLIARFLRDTPDTPTAFRQFEQLRRARVEKIVKYGARSSGSKAAGPVGRVIRDALLPLGLRMAAKQNTAWIHAHHVDWNAPSLPTSGTFVA